MLKKFRIILLAAVMTNVTSTAFAVDNPFVDLPPQHWAYDAVSELAEAGIIEGYGDGNYLGNRNLTRYEMAQIVAKALAKSQINSVENNQIDKLKAEFSDELKSFGIRIENLKSNADKVKFNGKLRYTYTSQRLDGNHRQNDDELLLRLEPTAEINRHWQIHSRIDLSANLSTDIGSDMKLKRAWAEGNYGRLKFKIGKYDNSTPYDKYLMFDGQQSGAEVSFGKVIKLQLGAGRINLSNDSKYDNFVERMTNSSALIDEAADIQRGILTYIKKKLTITRAIYHLRSDAFSTNFYARNGSRQNAYILESVDTYRFDDNLSLTGVWLSNKKADFYRHSHLIQVDYKNADINDVGSWSAHAAYIYKGGNASIDPNCDGAPVNTKGFEIGAKYTFMPNMQVKLIYFNGKQLENRRDAEKLFARVEGFF